MDPRNSPKRCTQIQAHGYANFKKKPTNLRIFHDDSVVQVIGQARISRRMYLYSAVLRGYPDVHIAAVTRAAFRDSQKNCVYVGEKKSFFRKRRRANRRRSTVTFFLAKHAVQCTPTSVVVSAHVITQYTYTYNFANFRTRVPRFILRSKLLWTNKHTAQRSH